MKILIPIDARLLVNNVEYKGIGTGLFTQLRLASDQETVKSTGTEIETSGVYEFEITGTALIEYLELWICTTEYGTYTKVKSWGGTDGIRQKDPTIEIVDSYSITSTTGDISFNSPAGAIEFNSGVNFVFNAETTIALNSNTGDIELTADGDISLGATSYSLTNLPVYADNAAAITGGLGANKLYRTYTGDLKIVYNP